MKKLFIPAVLISLILATLLSAQEKGITDSVSSYNNKSISLAFERQWAFIIAIDRYAYLTPLKYPVKEAKCIEELLENRYGYSSSRVKTLLDDKATYNTVMAQLKWYVQNLVEDDILFIYFSGHGYKDDIFKKGFWMPCDACSDKQANKSEKEKATETLVKISNHDIVDFLRECKARHIFVVADSCFSGQFFAAQPKVDRVPGTHYNFKSRQLFASGRELVGDGDFGKYFVRCLEANQEPYLLASDIITNVRTMVMNNTNLEPEGKPVKNTDDEGGEFILGRRLASLKPLEYKPNRPTTATDIDTSELKAEAERNRWQSWQRDFQQEVDDRQKSDEDKALSSTAKRKAWESILSKYNKDNPDTGEDEELRKFVKERMEYWAAKEKEELEWSTWQRKFNENVEKLKVIDKDPDISPSSKKQKWQELLNAYRMDNPYSDEDDDFREYAKERVNFWRNYIQISPKLIDNAVKLSAFNNDIGVASMLFSPKSKELQKVAKWIFDIQISLLKDIINLTNKGQNLKSDVRILSVSDSDYEFLSPYIEYESYLRSFHDNANRDPYTYLTEVARINQVGTIVFTSIDPYRYHEFISNGCRGEILLEINIFCLKEIHFTQTPILIHERSFFNTDSTELICEIEEATIRVLKIATENRESK